MLRDMTGNAAKQVFVVEDSAAVRARLIEMLREIDGVSVVGEAETPELAVRGIAQTAPDYVVLDFQLKGGTGAQVLRAVRRQLPRTVFIVLTNHAETQFRKVCVDAGADAFFDKSSEIGKVRDMIAGTEPLRSQAH